MEDAFVVEQRVEALLATHDPRATDPITFFGAQFDAGLAGVHFPIGLGGLGLGRQLQREVDERLRRAGAKSATLRNPLGVGMGMPTLAEHGTPAQMERYFRPCFTTAELWCQLFSEPGSGSDLAGLSTRAERDGNEWVVNGQKVWTSLAHVASVGMLLARSRPDLPKHRGMTYFLVDMHAPGVEVRPLRQMTGDAEFNEVFLTDVRLSDDQRVGEDGAGWRVATTTLMNERIVLSGAGSGASTVGGSRIEKLMAAARRKGATNDPVLRQELVQRWIEGQVIRWTNVRARAGAKAGRPGPEGSVTKLFQGLYNRRLQETAMAVHGLAAQAWRHDDADSSAVTQGFLRAQANTIEGGTSEILRNVLGERVLGLPREPGPGSDVAWTDLPRNG